MMRMNFNSEDSQNSSRLPIQEKISYAHFLNSPFSGEKKIFLFLWNGQNQVLSIDKDRNYYGVKSDKKYRLSSDNKNPLLSQVVTYVVMHKGTQTVSLANGDLLNQVIDLDFSIECERMFVFGYPYCMLAYFTNKNDLSKSSIIGVQYGGQGIDVIQLSTKLKKKKETKNEIMFCSYDEINEILILLDSQMIFKYYLTVDSQLGAKQFQTNQQLLQSINITDVQSFDFQFLDEQINVYIVTNQLLSLFTLDLKNKQQKQIYACGLSLLENSPFLKFHADKRPKGFKLQRIYIAFKQKAFQFNLSLLEKCPLYCIEENKRENINQYFCVYEKEGPAYHFFSLNQKVDKFEKEQDNSYVISVQSDN